MCAVAPSFSQSYIPDYSLWNIPRWSIGIYSINLTSRKTVDQLAEVGFEMVFYSFGSGFNLEAEDISGLKADIAYANSKGKA